MVKVIRIHYINIGWCVDSRCRCCLPSVCIIVSPHLWTLPLTPWCEFPSTVPSLSSQVHVTFSRMSRQIFPSMGGQLFFPWLSNMNAHHLTTDRMPFSTGLSSQVRPWLWRSTLVPVKFLLLSSENEGLNFKQLFDSINSFTPKSLPANWVNIVGPLLSKVPSSNIPL